jgi:tetratricopeptide (TPR) repeat protein
LLLIALAALLPAALFVNRAVIQTAWYASRPIQELREEAERTADPLAVKVLASRYLGKQQAAEAEASVSPLLERSPYQPDLWVLRARSELAQGKDARAFASASVALKMGGEAPEPLVLLGQIEERRGKEADAEKRYLRALELKPEDPDANYRLGRIELSHLQYGTAIGRFERVLKSRPGDAESLQLLAQARLETGQAAAAEAAARSAAQVAPASARAWFMLGTVLKAAHEADRRQEAEHAFRTALERDAAMHTARYEIGAILLQREEYASAARVLEQVTRDLPLNKTAYEKLAQCYLRLKRPQDADRVMREYHRLDEMDLSTAPIEYALWAMPDNIPLRVKLARLYRRYGRRDLAAMQITLALERRPGDRDALALAAELGTAKP